jgi:hypothetical protein
MLFSLPFLSFHVPFECFQGDTSDSRNEIVVCPQAWESPLELRELLPQVPATGTLDISHQSVYPKLWVTADEQMHMIRHDFHLDTLLSPLLNGFQDDSFQAFIYWRYEYLTPILRTKHDMVSADIGYVIIGFQSILHERSIAHKQ